MTTDPYDIVNTFDQAHWQPLFDLIPQMEGMAKFGEMSALEERKDGTISLPYMKAKDIVYRFVKIAEQIGILIPFDWMSWQEGSDVLSNKSFDYNTIDVPSKCKLITAIVRNDRFSEGYLVSCFNDGIILRILKSIQRQI